VTVRSAKPADLALNHHVLAYDYEQSAAEVTARAYDPNQGTRDDICIPATGTDPGGLSRRGLAVLVDNVIGHSGPPSEPTPSGRPRRPGARTPWSTCVDRCTVNGRSNGGKDLNGDVQPGEAARRHFMRNLTRRISRAAVGTWWPWLERTVAGYAILGIIVFFFWLVVAILAIVLLAYIVHWAGGGLLNLRLGHFVLTVGFT